MDKAKAYPLFEKDYPDALEGVLHAAPNATNYYDKFRLLIRDVWRFEEEDTLVFRIDLEMPRTARSTTSRRILPFGWMIEFTRSRLPMRPE